ncbi:MAG: twin-arginine translocase TatA/TatE family subunit [Legionella sp.]
MGLSGISPLSLLLILIIIIALFGTSKLKTIGTDLGEAIRNFRKSLNEDHTKEDNKSS